MPFISEVHLLQLVRRSFLVGNKIAQMEESCRRGNSLYGNRMWLRVGRAVLSAPMGWAMPQNRALLHGGGALGTARPTMFYGVRRQSEAATALFFRLARTPAKAPSPLRSAGALHDS